MCSSKKMYPITLLLWTIISLCKHVELVVVRVEEGLLHGDVRTRSTGNGQYCSFKGIPYAAPPIGELRFKDPQPPLKWDGERNATVHGSVCPQTMPNTDEYIPGSEDCLFLNVYTPCMNPKCCYPVMFYIHGGGFCSGSGNDDEYGPDFLIDQKVVLVTINYRLGALGFLCLDIKEAPGNAGLKDQVAALKWVKKNISKFGGDPTKVTIFGQDAGGVSVTLHTLSPLSKGLFKKAIAMSGTCFNEYAEAFEPKRQGLLLAYKVGFFTKDPRDAFKFLQNATVKSIVTTKANLLARDELKDYVFKSQAFPPVVEKNFSGQHFLTQKPEHLLRDGKTNIKEIVVGYTSHEGITTAVSQKELIFEIYPYFKELLVPSKMALQRDPKRVLDLAECIENHYFCGKEISEANMKKFIRLYTYGFYIFDIYRFLEMWVKCGNKAYLYEFNCFSERNVYGLTAQKYGIKGAGHKDDLMYLFDGKKYDIYLNKTATSYKMICLFSKLLTNIAKSGDPTPDKTRIQWNYYNNNQSMLLISSCVVSKQAALTEINFWKTLFHSAVRCLRFS